MKTNESIFKGYLIDLVSSRYIYSDMNTSLFEGMIKKISELNDFQCYQIINEQKMVSSVSRSFRLPFKNNAVTGLSTKEIEIKKLEDMITIFRKMGLHKKVEEYEMQLYKLRGGK